MSILSYLNPIKAVVDAVASPVKSVLNKRETTKQHHQQAKAKYEQAKLSSKTHVTLTDAEWEALSKVNENQTWKDEYATIIVTFPLLCIMVGGIYLAFTGDSRLLDGTNIAMERLASAGVDIGFLMNTVVLAAVGMKVWRQK